MCACVEQQYIGKVHCVLGSSRDNEGFDQLILVLYDVKYVRDGVDDLHPLGREVLVGADKLQQLDQYNDLLLLRKRLVDLFTDAQESLQNPLRR